MNIEMWQAFFCLLINQIPSFEPRGFKSITKYIKYSGKCLFLAVSNSCRSMPRFYAIYFLFHFRFDPERFSPENSKGREKFSFEPFGFAGKRKCPGYRFAYFETTVVLVKLVKNFKFKFATDKKISKLHHLVSRLSELWVKIEKRP